MFQLSAINVTRNRYSINAKEMSEKRGHEGKSSSPPSSCLLNEIFLKTVHEIRSIFLNLLDFFSNCHREKEKQLHNTRKKIYFEKFPAGHWELKISCDHPVA